MALRKSKQVAQRAPAIEIDRAGDALCVVSEYVVEAGLALNDIVEMCAFPPESVLVDAVVAVEDTDSNGTPTVKIDVGIMTGQYLAALEDDGDARACGTEILSASTLPQAGGMARLATGSTLLLSPSNLARSLGIKVNTAAATLTTGAKWRLMAWFAPAPVGIADA